MRKVYPLSLDPKVYSNLKAIADVKGITIKDALRQAIALLLADNLSMLTITKKNTTKGNHPSDGTKQSTITNL
tara:strand:+ start:120 stop:338 length:219 start_codon:yes stop_codon:yes gene_type:complete